MPWQVIGIVALTLAYLFLGVMEAVERETTYDEAGKTGWYVCCRP